MKRLLLLFAILIFLGCPSIDDFDSEIETICETVEEIPEKMEALCAASADAEYEEVEPINVEPPPECDSESVSVLVSFYVPEFPSSSELTIKDEEKQLEFSDEIAEQLNDPVYINHITLETAAEASIPLDDFLNWISLSFDDGTYFASNDNISEVTDLNVNGTINIWPYLDKDDQSIDLLFSAGLYSPAEKVYIDARFELNTLDCPD